MILKAKEVYNKIGKILKEHPNIEGIELQTQSDTFWFVEDVEYQDKDEFNNDVERIVIQAK